MAKAAAIGFLYGFLLMIGALASAGAGHGSYLPFAMCGAPLSLLPVVWVFAAPLWWGVVGALLAQRRPWSFVIMLAVHAGSVLMLAWHGSPMEPGAEIWRSFWATQRRTPLIVWGTVWLYVGGQAMAWAVALSRFASVDDDA